MCFSVILVYDVYDIGGENEQIIVTIIFHEPIEIEIENSFPFIDALFKEGIPCRLIEDNKNNYCTYNFDSR